MVSSLRITGSSAPLRGVVPVPSDESVTLARVALGALSRGTTTLEVSYPSTAVRALALGLSRTLVPVSVGEREIVVSGGGLGERMSPSTDVLDVRGEAPAAAYLLGLLGGRNSTAELLVDESVGQSLGRLLAELGLAELSESGGGVLVRLRPRDGRIPGFQLSLSGAVPWLKAALLALAMRASSPTEISEGTLSDDGFERALLRARAPVEIVGTSVLLHPPRDEDALAPARFEAVGSAEMAAYVAALVGVRPGSEIGVRGVSSNPTRADFWSVLRLHGASVGFSPRGDRQGEGIADFSVSAGELRGGVVEGENAVRLGDSVLPLLAALARVRGEFVVWGLSTPGRDGSPRVLARAVGFLRAAGVDAELLDGGVRVRGGASLRPLHVTTGGDARLALLASVLACGAEGESRVDDVECLREKFPRWVGTLRALGASVVVEAEAP